MALYLRPHRSSDSHDSRCRVLYGKSSSVILEDRPSVARTLIKGVNKFISVLSLLCEPDSSVGIANDYGAGRSGIESRWGRDFPPVQTGLRAHPAYCKMGTGSFPGIKCGRGVLLITHPLLVPRSEKSRAIPLYLPSGAHRAYNGITLLYLYFHF